MRTSKTKHLIIGIVIFILCAIVGNFILNFLLYPYTFARVDVHNLETNTYEDILVGGSHGKCGIDPTVLEETTKRATMNFCMGGEYMVDSYYIVKEACRVNKPKRVILEVDPTYWVEKMSQDTSFGQIFWELPFSTVKVEYFLAKYPDVDFRNGIFPWYLYRSQLTNIAKNVETKFSEEYKQYDSSYFSDDQHIYEKNGFIRKLDVGTKNEDKIVAPGLFWSEDKIQKSQLEFLDKMTALCEKEEIEFILVSAPVPVETLEQYKEDYHQAYEYFEAYAKAHGLEYYDFNENHPGYTIDQYADWEGHMYGTTADSFTQLLAEKLEE